MRLPQRETSLVFPVSVTGSDGGDPALGHRVVRYLRRRSTAEPGRSGRPCRRPAPRPPSPARATRLTPSTASPTTSPATSRVKTAGDRGQHLRARPHAAGHLRRRHDGDQPQHGQHHDRYLYPQHHRQRSRRRPGHLFRGVCLGRRRRLPGGRPLRHPGRRGRQQGQLHFDCPLPGPDRRQVAHLLVLQHRPRLRRQPAERPVQPQCDLRERDVRRAHAARRSPASRSSTTAPAGRSSGTSTSASTRATARAAAS